jgi:anti-sigma factor RsiW
MSGPCAHPVAFDVLIAYWAGELPQDETDAVDEHVMGCETCARASEQVAFITEGIRAAISPIITARELAALRARGLRIEENVVRPGQRTPLVFRANLDILVHRLAGLDLSGAERVQVTVRVEETGEVILENPAAPFDAAAGEVLIACQRHFSAFPPNIVFEVAAIATDGATTSATYTIPHLFEGSPALTRRPGGPP